MGTDVAKIEAVAAQVARRRSHAPIDPALVEQARRTASVLQDRRRDVLVAEAEHRAAVAAILETGASIRDIAASLGTSTSGVLAMVGELVAPARRGQQRRLACSFCGCAAEDARTIIAGVGTYICDRCVPGVAEQVRPDRPGRCSFCERDGWVAGGLAASADGTATVCKDCTDRFLRLLDEPGP